MVDQDLMMAGVVLSTIGFGAAYGAETAMDTVLGTILLSCGIWAAYRAYK